SKIGFKGGVRVQMEKEKQDIAIFFKEFITNICIPYYTRISINVTNEVSKKWIKTFAPFEITYLIDNFISNSKKARASEINFLISEDKNKLKIEVIDNGKGLDKRISNISDIFKRTVSTTRGGAGLGLYDAKKIISELGGTIDAEN